MICDLSDSGMNPLAEFTLNFLEWCKEEIYWWIWEGANEISTNEIGPEEIIGTLPIELIKDEVGGTFPELLLDSWLDFFENNPPLYESIKLTYDNMTYPPF